MSRKSPDEESNLGRSLSAMEQAVKKGLLRESAGDPPAEAFTGQASTYANYNVGWGDGNVVVKDGNRKVWSCSADEHKKLMKMGKIKVKGDTGLVRYLISIGVL